MYIKGKRFISKIRVVNAIELGFFLFGKRKKLVIFALTGFVSNSIDESIVNIVF